MLRRILPALAGLLLAPAVPAAAAAAAPCAGDPAQVRPIALTVEGKPATGIYTLPAAPPRGLVVFAHGAGNTSDAWRRHVALVARRDGVIAVAMDYRGMRVTGRDPKRGTEIARGWPAKAGSEDLVAAARHFDERCPGLPGIVMYGVSMGGNMSGLAVAARAERADGRPLFDYWFAIEGVHNLTESYLEARAVAPAVAFGKEVRDDMEAETGGPIEAVPGAYAERTNLLRLSDIVASGVRGVVLVHAYDDGTVPYNQSVEMTRELRRSGVPADMYSVGRKGPGEAGTTIGSYAGLETGLAGHGWEGSQTNVVVQTGLDRLTAQLTRGEPAPCNRDFRVDDTPSNVSPDPAAQSAACRPDPLPPAGAACSGDAPGRLSTRVGGNRRPRLSGRARGACIARVKISVSRREGGRRCRFVLSTGRLSERRDCRRPIHLRATGKSAWRVQVRRRLPRGRYVARAAAIDALGRSGPIGRAARFRVR